MSDSIDYGSGKNIQAGSFFITDQQPLAADTYYPGMLLEYDATNDVYIALATDANLAGIYNGGEERTLSAAGEDNIILAGEIQLDSVVDAAGAAVTLTQDQIAAYRDRGFYFK